MAALYDMDGYFWQEKPCFAWHCLPFLHRAFILSPRFDPVKGSDPISYKQRHSIRHVLQDSVVALLLVTITGDISSISSIGAALPTLMVQLKFSREFETEADDFAIRYLKENNISTEPLLELLKSLDEEYDEKDSKISNYFSSHPATIERIKKLKPN